MSTLARTILRIPAPANRMNARVSFLLIFIFALGLLDNASGQEVDSNSKSPDHFDKIVRPFLTKFCGDCHGKETGDADFFVHDLDGRIGAGKDIQRWEKIWRW